MFTSLRQGVRPTGLGAHSFSCGLSSSVRRGLSLPCSSQNSKHALALTNLPLHESTRRTILLRALPILFVRPCRPLQRLRDLIPCSSEWRYLCVRPRRPTLGIGRENTSVQYQRCPQVIAKTIDVPELCSLRWCWVGSAEPGVTCRPSSRSLATCSPLRHISVTQKGESKISARRLTHMKRKRYRRSRYRKPTTACEAPSCSPNVSRCYCW